MKLHFQNFSQQSQTQFVPRLDALDDALNLESAQINNLNEAISLRLDSLDNTTQHEWKEQTSKQTKLTQQLEQVQASLLHLNESSQNEFKLMKSQLEILIKKQADVTSNVKSKLFCKKRIWGSRGHFYS